MSPRAIPVRLQRGFSLLELMVAVAIMAVLAALIAPSALENLNEARRTTAKSNIKSLTEALKFYKMENGRYPTTEQGLQALVAKPATQPVPANWRPYIEKLPTDPWGQSYQYLSPGVKGEIDVISYGADGKPGGEGVNADIDNWQ
jgi:general secretion pathway protein G